MEALAMQLRQGHLFVELAGEPWLLDSGAPGSFGQSPQLALAGQRFPIGPDYLGLTAATLSQLVGVSCAGLIGCDVLNRFDCLLDVPAGQLTVSTAELCCGGRTVPLAQFMGIPIAMARVGGRERRMFVDTGAQVSYLQDEGLAAYPSAGRLTDFYPGFGPFVTDTHEVPVSIGGLNLNLRCGRLPDLLGLTLMMAGTEGILGNQVLHDRVVGFFPRRQQMIVGASTGDSG